MIYTCEHRLPVQGSIFVNQYAKYAVVGDVYLWCFCCNNSGSFVVCGGNSGGNVVAVIFVVIVVVVGGDPS